MSQHRVTVEPGTATEGVTARLMLQWPDVKRSEIRCPYCDALIPVPGTLEPQIRELAARLGGETAYVRYVIHHPPEIPPKPGFRTVSRDSAEFHEIEKRTTHDIP